MSSSSSGEPDDSKRKLVRKVNHVSVKLPEFSEATAAGWFPIVEAQFNLAKITKEDTKFFHAVSGIPPSLITRLPSSILENYSYTELKNAILSISEKSKPEMFEALLNTQTIAGKPSVCLSQMRSMATKVAIGDEFVRHKFLQMLPSNISPVIAASSTLTLDQIGALADELVSLPIGNSSAGIAYQIGHSQSASPSSNYPYHYHGRRQDQFNNRRGSQPAIPNSLKPFHSKQRPVVCRAHLYFGQEARTCKPWCRWPNKGNCTMESSSRPQSPIPRQRLNRNQDGDLNSQGTR